MNKEKVKVWRCFLCRRENTEDQNQNKTSMQETSLASNTRRREGGREGPVLLV